MKLTNELFARALQWLYDHDEVKDQKELAEKTGITATTVSRILNDKVRQPSPDTARRLEKAFPGIFDKVADKRQQQITDRAKDIQRSVLGHVVEEPEFRQGFAAEDTPRPYLPTWADTLLSILSKQVAENELLHSELRQSIEDVNKMKEQLSLIIEKIK